MSALEIFKAVEEGGVPFRRPNDLLRVHAVHGPCGRSHGGLLEKGLLSVQRQAPARQFSPCRHRPKLRPDYAWRNAPHSGRRIELAICAGRDAGRIINGAGDQFQTIRNHYLMLDKVCERIDYTCRNGLIGGLWRGFKNAPFVGMARVGDR